MKIFFSVLIMSSLMAVSAHAEDQIAGATGDSESEAVGLAQQHLAKRVTQTCLKRGGVADGIAPAVCTAYVKSTGKWNAQCQQLFQCNKP